MILSEADRRLYYKLHPSVLLYANHQRSIFKDIKTLDDFMKVDIKKKMKIRNELYENIRILDQFYEENPENYTDKELSIILSWKHFIKDRFIVYKQYKKYCVFLHQERDTKAFGVLGLTDPIEDILPMLPCMVETVLLPFKECIVYDGFVLSSRISFGTGIRADFKESYDKAKVEYGIIEQLPFKSPSEQERNAGLLRYYLKNADNMAYYEIEIEELLEKNPSLLPIYHKELGNNYSKHYRKRFKALGVRKVWFAILDDVVVGSGRSKAEAEENAKRVLSDELKDYFVLFEVK